MNAHPLEPARWTPRRWLYAVALVFLAQVAMIFFAGEPPHHPHRAPQFRTTINLAVDPWSEQQLAQLPTLSDPTLFALPNLDGFSGAAWLTFAPLEHQVTVWTNSSHWLELEKATLGKSFLAFVNTNTPAPLLIADDPLPALPSLGPHLTNEPLIARSELRLEGDLARRPLLNPPVLPSWPHSDILTNTVVQVLVDADGDTLPTLLSSCGLSDPDQWALKTAANSQFQSLRKNVAPPAAASQVMWGKMVFLWHTVPILPTNTASSRP